MQTRPLIAPQSAVIVPHQPVRQWVLSFLWPPRMLFAARPEVLSRCLAIVTRGDGVRFRRVPAPNTAQLTQLLDTLIARIPAPPDP